MKDLGFIDFHSLGMLMDFPHIWSCQNRFHSFTQSLCELKTNSTSFVNWSKYLPHMWLQLKNMLNMWLQLKNRKVTQSVLNGSSRITFSVQLAFSDFKCETLEFMPLLVEDAIWTICLLCPTKCGCFPEQFSGQIYCNRIKKQKKR